MSSQRRGKGRRGWVAHLSRLLQRHQRLGLPAVRLSAVFVADLLGLRVARQGAVQFSASRGTVGVGATHQTRERQPPDKQVRRPGANSGHGLSNAREMALGQDTIGSAHF